MAGGALSFSSNCGRLATYTVESVGGHRHSPDPAYKRYAGRSLPDQCNTVRRVAWFRYPARPILAAVDISRWGLRRALRITPLSRHLPATAGRKRSSGNVPAGVHPLNGDAVFARQFLHPHKLAVSTAIQTGFPADDESLAAGAASSDSLPPVAARSGAGGLAGRNKRYCGASVACTGRCLSPARDLRPCGVSRQCRVKMKPAYPAPR